MAENSSALVLSNPGAINQFIVSLVLRDGIEDRSIMGFIDNMSIIQSLLRYSMSLEMSIYDGFGLVDNSILKVGSELELTLYRHEDEERHTKIIKKFYVTEIKNSIQSLNNNERVYDIIAHTYSGASNAWPFTQCYTEQVKPSDIIKDIVKMRFTSDEKEIGNNADVQNAHWVDSDNKLKAPVIFKQVKPFDAITNMLIRNVSGKNASFFYEDKDGFKLRSIKHMTKESKNVFTYTFYPDKKPNKTAEEDYYKILYLSQHNNSDYFEIVENGVFSGEVVYIDLLNRQIKTAGEKKYTESEYRDTLLNNDGVDKKYDGFDINSKLFAQKGASSLMLDNPDVYDFTPASKIVFSETAWDREDYMEEKYPYDNAQRALFEQNKVTIEVYGNPEIRPGDIVDVVIPKQYEERNSYSNRLHGEFLVTAVRHNIKGNKFQTFIDINKDGYEQDIISSNPDDESTIT